MPIILLNLKTIKHVTIFSINILKMLLCQKNCCSGYVKCSYYSNHYEITKLIKEYSIYIFVISIYLPI